MYGTCISVCISWLDLRHCAFPPCFTVTTAALLSTEFASAGRPGLGLEAQNVVGRLDSMGRPIAHLSDWRAALLSAKARAMDTPTSGGLTFVERNMEELPGLLAAIDAHVDVIRQVRVS